MGLFEEIRIIHFQAHGDEKGRLVVIEGEKDIPFDIKRVFYIFGSDADAVRGRHANRHSAFVLINVAGQSKLRAIDHSGQQRVYDLDEPHMGIFLPAGVWKEMYDFSPDSVLLCLASTHYDPREYVRDFDAYLNDGNTDIYEDHSGFDVLKGQSGK